VHLDMISLAHIDDILTMSYALRKKISILFLI
ncbi:unnamed protein product, partial [Rotaria sp. Silwood2]